MKRRLLILLLTAIFTAQAAGITGALHLEIEDRPCREHARAGVECEPSGKIPASLRADSDPCGEAHDPDHCGVCQALAAFFPEFSSEPAAILGPKPSAFPCVPQRSSPFHSLPLGTLGARAPPLKIL